MQVKVFSTPGCNMCWATEKRLKKNGIDYQVVKLDEDEQARVDLQARGYGAGTQAPVVMVERDGVVVDSWTGFKVTRIDALKEQ